MEPKLIILRGPTASGKSTVATALLNSAQRKTVLIEQDHYQFIFHPKGTATNYLTIRKMILQNVMQALEDGYDVILEGILSVRAYAETLEEIFDKHPTENYIFFFDVSLEETLRRHSGRDKSSDFGEDKMREWYPVAHKSGHMFEHIIPEQSTIDQTVKLIKETSGI